MKENVYKKNEKINIVEVPEGIVLPRIITDQGPSWGLGGVCDKEGKFVESSFYDGGWAQHGGAYPIDCNILEIDCSVIYIGLFVKHWGHYLIDCLSKDWILTKEPYNRFKIAYVGEEELQGNYLELLKLLGIREEQLIHITKPTRFAKVIVAEAAFRPCIWYTEEYINMLDHIVDQALTDQEIGKKFPDIDKVYFSRGKFNKAINSEFGESFFEDTFVKNGYISIAPETLSLKEQIYVWNKAKRIICMNGSIPLNVMFCKNENLKFTILNKMSIYHKNPYLLLFMRKINAEFVDIYREPLKNYPKSLGEGPYLMEVTDDFRRYCVLNGYELIFDGFRLKSFNTLQLLKYFLCILNVKGRIYRLISGFIPSKLKSILRNR